ncbi:hypothetical protein GGS26DRAFT_444809 [Hypomontagnella submonticulosa]|nr:hypothetical protein GGS26DRAFT_444809 [Hypomontagnella submonticulosa]
MKFANVFTLCMGATVPSLTMANPIHLEGALAHDTREIIPRGQPTWDQFWSMLDKWKNCMKIEKTNRYGPTLQQWFDDCNAVCMAELGGNVKDASDWYIGKYGKRWKGIVNDEF